MRKRSGVALVHLVLLCAFLGTSAGCGKDSIIKSTTSPTNTTQFADNAFKVSGDVYTATGQSLPGATVQARWASGSTSTVSVGDMGSRYELSIPVAGDLTVRAEMDGYDAVEKHLTINAHTHLDIPMMRTLPSDQYRLTFAASPSCSLPADATPRQYTAGLEVETSGQAKVYLRGGVMLAFMGEAGFTGVRDGNTLRFWVNDDDMGPYAFVEFLPGHRWLSYSGTITGTIEGDRIAATFDGRVRLVQYPAESVVAECTAADHRMEFAR